MNISAGGASKKVVGDKNKMARKKTKNISIFMVSVFVLAGLTLLVKNVYAGSCIYDDGSCSNGAQSVADCSGGHYSASNCPSNNSGGAGTAIEFANPIAFTTVAELLNAILNNLMGVIVFISVIFIIIGGVMYMMSAGNEAMITRAKKTWLGAVIGLAIALAAPTFLKEIQNILGGATGTGGSADQWVSNALTIRMIAINILNLLLSVIGIVAIIAMVIGGGTYLTAYGDEKKIDTGKRIITYAIIGIIVSLASLVIVRQVDTLIRGGSQAGTGGNNGISTNDPAYQIRDPQNTGNQNNSAINDIESGALSNAP